MEIEQFPLGPLNTNCYFLYNSPETGGKREGVIIDPADGGQFLAQKSKSAAIDVVAILATHGHFDHNLGAGELQLLLKSPYFISKKDLFLLKNINQSASFWLKSNILKPLPQQVDYLKEGDTISFAKIRLQVLSTPGHTPGSVAFFCDYNGKKAVFSGDTVFREGVGRHDFSYSDKQKLNSSVEKILSLPPDTVVYSGHGSEATVEEIRGNRGI